MKLLLKSLVIEDNYDLKGITFLLNSNQIINDLFLEDINSLLNNGEIPNLFINDELEDLLKLIKGHMERNNIQSNQKE